jgi:hypothetical protein
MTEEGVVTMSTTTQQNKDIIRRFFDAWNSRQPDAFDDLIAPNVIRHCEATPGMEARSLDQVKEFLRQMRRAFSAIAASRRSPHRSNRRRRGFGPRGGALPYRVKIGFEQGSAHQAPVRL